MTSAQIVVLAFLGGLLAGAALVLAWLVRDLQPLLRAIAKERRP